MMNVTIKEIRTIQFTLLKVISFITPLAVFLSLLPIGDLTKYIFLVYAFLEFVIGYRKGMRKYLADTNALCYPFLFLALIFLINYIRISEYRDFYTCLNYIFAILLTVLLINYKIDKKQFLSLCRCSLLSVYTYAGIIAISMLLTPDFNRVEFYIFHVKIHPNYQTIILTFGLAVSCYLMHVTNLLKNRKLIFHFMNMILFLIIIIMGARAELIAALLIYVIYAVGWLEKKNFPMYIKGLITSDRKRFYRLLIGLSVSFIIVLVVLQFSGIRVFDFIGMIQDGGSGRNELWNAALEINKRDLNIFGLGFGYFEKNSYVFIPTPMFRYIDAHNTFITLQIEAGYAGLFLLLFVFYKILKSIRMKTIVNLVFFIAAVVPSFFANNFGSMSFWLPLLFTWYSMSLEA